MTSIAHDRRSLLRAAAGLTLASVVPTGEGARAGESTATADTSVILLWMSGGPGHHETWDPKPEAVAQYRGPFEAISTSVPGVLFSETLPESSRWMHRMGIVRSVRHGTGDHTKGNHWMLTGFEGPDFNKPDNKVQRRPSLGSAASAVRGANVAGMPAYAAAPHLRGGTDNHFHYATYLGGAHDPFVVNSDPNSARYRVHGLSLGRDVSFERLENRRQLLGTIDHFRERLDQRMEFVTDQQQLAFDLLTSREVAEAFRIDREPDAVRDSYGRHEFGQSALLARRLVERGVTFVTVNTQPWDHHGTANRLPTEKGAKQLLPPFDRALAGLLADLEARGLSERTLVVAMGEFGRTPKMNSAAGRDHWGHTFSVLFAGGRVRPGTIVGASDERGAYVVDRPTSPEDVAATIYDHLGIDGRHVAIPDRAGRPRYLVEHGKPIAELFG